MAEPIEFPYSKNFAFLGLAMPVIFFLITFPNFRASFMAGYTLSYIIIGIADLIFLSLFIFVLIKRMIPALRNEIALELNEDGITDYIRNIVIEWADIKEINIEMGRNSSKMVIDLKQETDYGTQIAIPLRWIRGNDVEICNTTQAYFEEMGRVG